MFYHDDSLGKLRIQYFFVGGPIFAKMYKILHEIKRNWVLRVRGAVADPGFPRGGGANSPGGTNIRFWQNFPKTAWNWKNLDPRGDARPKFYYVDPPLGWSFSNLWRSFYFHTQGGNCVGLWRHLVFFEAEPSSETDAELASERKILLFRPNKSTLYYYDSFCDYTPRNSERNFSQSIIITL